MNLFTAIVVGLIALSTASGTNKLSDAAPANPYLVTAEAKQSRGADELKQDFPMLSSFIRNGYTAFRITYNTVDTEGKDIIASGALFVPDSGTVMPLLNYNHGTLFPSKERYAPSYLQSGAELNIGKLFAAAGYIVAMPDYIGYGATKNRQHDYGAYNVIANSATDMLYAVKEFCEKEHISLSGKNFFSGWSEGAAVALATVKKLEESNSSIKPTSTVVNAGPYHTSGFINHILDAKEDLKYMNSYAWVLATYNRIYQINRPLNYYFSEPAATALAKDPEASITHDPGALLMSGFIQNYKAGKDTALQQAMVRNDLWDWKPASRIVFCHGDRDDYVPVFNSEKAYSSMHAKGADVSLKILKGQTHSSGVYGFLMEAFTNFEAAK